MGVIKKILYRGNILGKSRHRNLFLDMEENIHIHYRDLRIELSRNEFEEIADIFQKQSQELLAIIREKNYQDGKLPNANLEDVRIWTESSLKNEVKYHPRRFSLEECGDGYHLHYRNFKILIDQAEFRQIAQQLKTMDMNGPYAASYDEVLALLEANEVDFLLASGNQPGEVLSISVARHHLPKINSIFEYIGFSAENQENERHYRGAQLSVIAKVDNLHTPPDFKRIRGQNEISQLAEFLALNGATLNPNELNHIKCQVLDFYSGTKSGQIQNFEADPQLWLYAPANKQVIFPYKALAKAEKTKVEHLYQAWSTLLSSLKLGFVKPDKEIFPTPEQDALQQQVADTLRKEVASVIAVDRIFIMGSASRQTMGRYQTPFVHGKLAKLGSDVDILIEINPDREDDIPDNWHSITPCASNHCAVYHLGQIPLAGGAGEWQAVFPHMEFTHHLLDAYVYFPSRRHQEDKDGFLRKFGAKVFYDRARDGAVSRGKEEEELASLIEQLYPLKQVMVEKMTVSTQNELYRVAAENKNHILKLFKVSGNYNRSRITEHTEYEVKLIKQLQERGVPTAGVIPMQEGTVARISGFPALLFERLPGTVCGRPEYPMDKIGAALAEIHHVQMERPLDLPKSFSFEDICGIWLPTFHDYALKQSHSAPVAEAFAKLTPIVRMHKRPKDRAALLSRSISVHNHGDVTPKNVIIDADGNVRFFDFNNAFFGPRLADILDGAFEFSLAEKYIDAADFARFDDFIKHYTSHYPLTSSEYKDLSLWIGLMGVIKFTKEVRVLLDSESDGLRKRRALAIAEFVLAHVAHMGSTKRPG
ncbi:MAG: phosphotransferase [Sulfuricellaceae bacterium]|nr:phosphotransferase [Sulfuricellaceae bacterium]